MKITQKNLEKLIKEEVKQVLAEKQRLNEALPLLIGAVGVYLAKGIFDEVVFSGLVDDMGLNKTQAKALAAVINKSEERVLLHVYKRMRNQAAHERKQIDALEKRIVELEKLTPAGIATEKEKIRKQDLTRDQELARQLDLDKLIDIK